MWNKLLLFFDGITCYLDIILLRHAAFFVLQQWIYLHMLNVKKQWIEIVGYGKFNSFKYLSRIYVKEIL